MNREVLERFRSAREVVRQPVPLTLLRLGQDRVDLVHGAGTTPDGHVEFQLGYRILAETCIGHWPPTPAELERAIEVTEDELMRVPALPRGGLLFSSKGVVARLLGRLAPGFPDSTFLLEAEDIEKAFQDMASVSLGRPARAADAVTDRADAAALVLLRELMHHLGFTGIAVPPPA